MQDNYVYTNWPANFTVAAITVLAVATAVIIHYEGLRWINRRLEGTRRHQHVRRRAVLYAIFALLLLHIIEIWIFGLAYHGLLLWPDIGVINGALGHSVFDHVYFSATVFTTVGFGDLSPMGPIRFLAGTEGLTGLVLVGWSASFTYLEMEHLWRPRP